MDPRASKPKPHPKRNPEQVSSRRPNRLFLSETIPPTIHHQHHPQANLNRNNNLSDRVHEYYEKLVKNSQLVKREDHQFQGFAGPYDVDHRPVSGPRHDQQLLPSVSMQAASSTARQPYTVFVDDPTGSFQRYKKKQSPTHPSGTAYFESSSNKTAIDADSMKGQDRSKSPLSSRIQCALCHSLNHTFQNCSLNSRVPAEHDGFFSNLVPGGSSPPTRHSKGSDENQGDGSEDRNSSTAFSRRRTTPANINIHCERDVIGQEKSPVSKSHPMVSGALSTSSSNGDSVPRERRKWVRPPLVGQAASSEKSPFMSPDVFDCLGDPSAPQNKEKISVDRLQLSSSTGSDQTDTRESAKVFTQTKSSYFDSSAGSCVPPNNDDFPNGADRDVSSVAASQHLTSEGEQGLSDSCVGGRVSPSSSVTSNRRLEWDSGADVGYNQIYGSTTPDASAHGLCTIERMALAQGCSVALHLRLDPEGTTVPASSSVLVAPVFPISVQDNPTPRHVGKPTAESTPVDLAPYIAKKLKKFGNDPINVISPILHGIMVQSVKGNEVEQQVSQKDPSSESTDSQGSSSVPFHRQLSNSMQDLRKCANKQSEGQLSKSQSDPDVSSDTPTHASKTVEGKFLKGLSKGRNLSEVHVGGHSISSGSDATLVHVGTEEDLAIDLKDGNVSEDNLAAQYENRKDSVENSQNSGAQTSATIQASVDKSGKESTEEVHRDKSDRLSNFTQAAVQTEKNEATSAQSKPTKSGSNTSLHVCSDTDHKRGLHHHFGVLCSTVLGGHIQSPAQPNIGSQPHNVVRGPDRVFANSPKNEQGNQSRETTQSPPLQDSDIHTGESTGSSALHSDAVHDERAPCASTLTGRANSFEYLPGHMYEKNPKSGPRKHERPPGISTSTETDSEPARPMSRAMHRRMIDSSSHDTEDDRLWASPRTGSNTLVEDLERGVNLLKGVMENKSAGRRNKQELIRRIIKKLVTSEYVEDIIEKEKIRHLTHSPFSPRKAKFPDRNMRSKRNFGSERQEISGESDEPKRTHNARRKINTHQNIHHPPASRTLSTLASGSKTSSLWSSNADSTSGTISLSGSSDNHKESKDSVKTNPLYEPQQENADWLQPATQSEKLFEMRKNVGATQAEKHLAELIGVPLHDTLIDPIAFKNDPQKQLSWVKNEITHLRVLKQLLQKQESLKQSLDPNLCRTNYTTMPVTGLKQTMQMADCISPDVPESRSPKLKPSRRQQWISLESDTSAGFGLSNNTGSSHDSNWQEVEVASPREQGSHPHRTVSISDNDQMTDASCSLSNRKSDVSPTSGQKVVQRLRRRSVSISDADGPHGPGTDASIQKKRSDCHCGKPDSRVYNSRPPHVATYGPPLRNLYSDVYPKQACPAHSSGTRTSGSLPANRGASMQDSSRTGTTGVPHSCSCGASRAPIKSSCCSSAEQSTGAVKKSSSGSSHQVVRRADTQPLPGASGGTMRLVIDTDPEADSARGKSQSESQTSSVAVHITEESDVGRQASDDSITKAVSQAVSAKVKALRNLGQIEEAEVKIRVRVAPGQEDVSPQSERGRVLKSQDLDDEQHFRTTKCSELDDLISRQRAMDFETRQKLLSIAESRQRAQFDLEDMDRRIQDLLLQDYLSRHTKTPDNTSPPQLQRARLNVRVEAPVTVGVQSQVDQKSTGTWISAPAETTFPGRDESYVVPPQPYVGPPQSYVGPPQSCVCGSVPPQSCVCGSVPPQPYVVPPQSCVCGSVPPKSCVCGSLPPQSCVCGSVRSSARRQSRFAVSQFQQTEVAAQPRPQTAPTSCVCSCRSQPASVAGTYRACRAPERQLEFELELRKKQPLGPARLTPRQVHETLKARNKAYFLQFEEDATLDAQPEMDVPKPPMEVVKVKIPKPKPTLSSSTRPASAGGKKKDKAMPSAKRSALRSAQPSTPSSAQASTPQSAEPSIARVVTSDGTSNSGLEISISNQGQVSIRGSAGSTGSPPLLRTTPGRSHLSITFTDSSPDSDGDSRSSRYSPRKHRKSPRPGSRREKKKIFPDGSSSPSTQSKPPDYDNDCDSAYNCLGDNGSLVPTLQEYLEKNHPKYLDAAEKRRRCIAEMSYLRRLRQQSRKRLMELDGDNMWARQKQQWRSRCVSRPRPAPKKRPSPKSSKSLTSRKYMFLPERQQRMQELKKREEKRTNRLMAEIYTRKLQEKVLKGTATIRSSVSVISSL